MISKTEELLEVLPKGEGFEANDWLSKFTIDVLGVLYCIRHTIKRFAEYLKIRCFMLKNICYVRLLYTFMYTL